VYAVAVQSDGKAIIGGSFTQYNGSSVSSGLIRLNTDGSLDAAFNNSGAGVGGSTATVYALAIDAGGNVVVGGNFNQYNGVAVPSGLIRLTGTGVRDTSFNSGGVGIGGGWVSDTVYSLVIQPSDGRIVIGGDFTAYNGSTSAPDLVLRVNSNGTLDTTGYIAGNGSGVLNTLYPLCGRPAVYALALQPVDEKIVIGGHCFNAYSNDGVATDIFASDNIQRLNTDGTLDITFNHLPQYHGFDDTVYALVVQPSDGKIIVGGRFTVYNDNIDTPADEGSDASDGILRIHTDGSIDTSFNFGSGRGVVNTSDALPEVVYAIGLQQDGRIIIGGADFNAFNDDGINDTLASDRLLRLYSNGTLDSSFNYGPINGTNAVVRALGIQPSAPAPYNAKAWVGGGFTSYNSDLNAPDRIMRLDLSGNVGEPLLTSITRSDGNPTNSLSVSFAVTFSESVTGGSVSNFALTTTGVTGSSITSVSGAGATRTVTVNTGSGNGTIRLDMLNSAGIIDSVGNPIGNLPFAAGEVYTIIKVTPTNTPTPVPTFTPTPTSSVITIGETNILTTDDTGNANILVAQQAVLSESATIESLSFYVATTGGQLRLGIYSNNNGNPGTLLAQTAAFTPTTAGWNTQNVQAPVLLPPGTYWLTFLPQSNTMHYRVALNGTARGASYTFGSMPSAFPSSPLSGSFHWSFYATLIR